MFYYYYEKLTIIVTVFILICKKNKYYSFHSLTTIEYGRLTTIQAGLWCK